MRSLDIPSNRNQFRQLKLLFNLGAMIRDIDFSHWYKHLTMIVSPFEYLDPKFPYDSVFSVKFLGVRRFAINLPKKNVELTDPRGLSVDDIDQFTKEKVNQECFYRISTFHSEGGVPCLEIDFDDVEIAFLGTLEQIDRIEKGVLFFSPRAKEKILF